MRFYEARGGVVAIDGHDVTSLDPAWLRSRLAFVQQEPVLFGVNVRENVAYALAAADARHARAAGHLATAATRTQAEQEGSLQARVEKACRKAHAHAFISELPDGYDTLVGERGVKLSGGQKQRLAIARALLAQPRILLLDEATSALDAESERLVQKAIDEASAGRSVIVVAHRLSTVRDADQIAVMSQGVIADCGTHAELIERCDMYQTLVQRQMSGAEMAPSASEDAAQDVSDSCTICMSSPRAVRFLPCRHAVMCEVCAMTEMKRTGKCSHCRRPVEGLVFVPVTPLRPKRLKTHQDEPEPEGFYQSVQEFLQQATLHRTASEAPGPPAGAPAAALE